LQKEICKKKNAKRKLQKEKRNFVKKVLQRKETFLKRKCNEK